MTATLCPAGFGYKDGQPHVEAVARRLWNEFPTSFQNSNTVPNVREVPRCSLGARRTKVLLHNVCHLVGEGTADENPVGAEGPTFAVARRRGVAWCVGSCRHLAVGGEQSWDHGVSWRGGVASGVQIRRPLEAVIQACVSSCACDKELLRALGRVTFIQVILDPPGEEKISRFFILVWSGWEADAPVGHGADVSRGGCRGYEGLGHAVGGSG